MVAEVVVVMASCQGLGMHVEEPPSAAKLAGIKEAIHQGHVAKHVTSSSCRDGYS